MTPAVGETLHRLLHAYRRAMRNAYAAAQIDLTVAQIRMIKRIAHAPDASARDIADQTGQDKGQIARLIKALERRELIVRRPHPDDSRSRQLHLSPLGRRMAHRIAEAEAEAGAAMARGLRDADIARFVSLAEALIVNLEPAEEPS